MKLYRVTNRIWKQIPDLIEEDGQRLGAHYTLTEYP